jgi:hypothetical protein
MQSGDSTAVVVTLTRTAPFTSDVNVTVFDAPTGVSVASQTISGAATTATLMIKSIPAAAAATTTLRVVGTTTSPNVILAPQTLALTVTRPINQIGADIINSGANFGKRVALSADGSRMVVAANSAANGGTTRVYERSGSTWTQLGGDIVAEAAGDLAGMGVDINAAGTRIAIGAPYNGGPLNGYHGHVRVYDLVGSTWTQVGADIDGIRFEQLGSSVALSASGTRLIAGGPNQVTATAGSSRVFDLVGGTWTAVGAKITGGPYFGSGVEISADGTTIAVGEPSRSTFGSVKAYRLTGGSWTQVGSTMTGTEPGEDFGVGIALTANGSRIVVSAPYNTAGGGVGRLTGVVRVFDLVGATWTQLGSTVVGRGGEAFGRSVAISNDGTRWAAAAEFASSARTYTMQNGNWVQTWADIVSSTDGNQTESVALSADGATIALGFYQGTPKRVSVFSLAP